MTKEEVIRGCSRLVMAKAAEMGLDVEDEGTGRGFDGSFWEGELHDRSGIPKITARGEWPRGTYQIGLRPKLWDGPEICVRRQTSKGEELLILLYSDLERAERTETGAYKYENTGDFKVHEIRVDVYESCYKAAVNEVYGWIEEIEQLAREGDESHDDGMGESSQDS